MSDDELELCPHCGQMVPCGMVQDMMIGQDNGTPGYVKLCPICSLRVRNELHGMDLLTPFTGPVAHSMFMETVAHLGKRAPKWARRVYANCVEATHAD